MPAVDCDPIDAVHNELFRVLAYGQPKKQTIARALGLTPKSLSRRLADRNTTFEEVLAGLRRILAEEYLKMPELRIDQIALLLGYRQVGSFSHAFRPWNGHSPSADRKT
jgi:AraC-like DNA-binding protein